MVHPFKQHETLIKAAQDAQRSLAPTQNLVEQLIKWSEFRAGERTVFAEAIIKMQKRQEVFKWRYISIGASAKCKSPGKWPIVWVKKSVYRFMAIDDQAKRLLKRSDLRVGIAQ